MGRRGAERPEDLADDRVAVQGMRGLRSLCFGRRFDRFVVRRDVVRWLRWVAVVERREMGRVFLTGRSVGSLADSRKGTSFLHHDRLDWEGGDGV